MSRTNKDTPLGKNKSGRIRGKKLTPYEGKDKFKFVPDLGNALGITKLGRLITKNANRSLKKAERSRVKNSIKNELNLNHDNQGEE